MSPTETIDWPRQMLKNTYGVREGTEPAIRLDGCANMADLDALQALVTEMLAKHIPFVLKINKGKSAG